MQRDLRLVANNAPAPIHVEHLWQAFVDAQERSKETRAVVDGIAAGKAYAAFLAAFVAPDLRISRRANGGGQ
jgi:hypothetical protein